MKVYRDITEIVGNTPIVELGAIERKYNLKGRVFAKLESKNPAGSAKDRIALEMINDLERRGLIDADTKLIEPTSGNTGIGLAAICAARGYHAVIIMPESMSEERKILTRAYGAELILTTAAQGMAGAVAKANEMVAADSKCIIVGQFYNPANPAAHYKTTGPEIWADMDGQVDALVAGVGTGGTLCGAGRYLREQKSDLYICAAEPFESPLMSAGKAGPHGIQGIGANFIPDNMDVHLPNEIMTVKTQDALSMMKELSRCTGIFAGISSGCAVYAAMQLALRDEFAGKNIIAVLPDSGERYLSAIEI